MDEAPQGQHCLCELDPFATSMQANIRLDVGDKYDDWNLLFLPAAPAQEFDCWKKRVYMRLAIRDLYPNEHFTMRSNRDRSKALKIAIHIDPAAAAGAGTSENRRAWLANREFLSMPRYEWTSDEMFFSWPWQRVQAMPVSDPEGRRVRWLIQEEAPCVE